MYVLRVTLIYVCTIQVWLKQKPSVIYDTKVLFCARYNQININMHSVFTAAVYL